VEVGVYAILFISGLRILYPFRTPDIILDYIRILYPFRLVRTPDIILDYIEESHKVRKTDAR
jgi:hypothetical protein